MWFCPTLSHTQDSIPTINIDSIVVTANRHEFEKFGKRVYIPTISPIDRTIGDALTYSTPINFKQYGPGMLQSASARGTGAGHLGVNWNGINIQSIIHGQVDFGLIGISENVSYLPGANGAMNGSGNLGGLVRLNTKIRKKNGWHGTFSGNWASFANTQQTAQLRYTTKKWASLSEINHKQGKNDFPFVNTTSVGQPVIKQVNNGYQAINLRQSNQWLINTKHVLNVHYWMTMSERQVPPSMTSANDLAVQEDQSHRFLADWKYQLYPSLSIHTKLAQIAEQLIFENQALHSFTATTKQVFDSRVFLKKGNHQWQLGLLQSLERAFSDNYESLTRRLTSAISLSDNVQIGDNLGISLQSRLEAKDFSQVIPIFSISGKYALQNWAIEGNFGRHFHAPTFNDLYWQDLGVRDLKDEVGYQGEIGFSHQIHNNDFMLSYNICGFWLDINDWILWTPDNSGTWRPSNNKKVVSKGIETNSYISYKNQDFTISTNIGYTFVSTINKESKKGKTLIGKQLLYIPKHKANGRLSLNYKKKITFTYSHLFVSKRPYKQDNSKYVASYSIQNIHVAYLQPFKKVKLNIHLAMTNLSDKSYQIIRFRPMPGRGLEGGVSIMF